MKATARFQAPLRPMFNPPVEPVYRPEDRDPARIEAAMLALGRADAATGRWPLDADPIPESEYPRTDIGWILLDPVTMALKATRARLLIHLQHVVGHDAAAAINTRVNAALFAEFERPKIDAAGPRQ